MIRLIAGLVRAVFELSVVVVVLAVALVVVVTR